MRLIFLLPLALLAACGSSRDAAGGVSADDQRALNDAAAMLDGNSVAAPDGTGNAQ